MKNIDYILAVIGGRQKAAEVIGVSKKSIYDWGYPKNKGGRGGLIPTHHQACLLAYAKEHGIDLRPDDFFYPERLAAIIAANPEKYPPIKRGRKRRADG